MTLSEACDLTYRQTIYHSVKTNADGSALRARVNGKISRWARNPNRISIPLKHGLKTHFYLTESNLAEWLLFDPTEESQDPATEEGQNPATEEGQNPATNL